MAESEDENRSAGERETNYERLLALDAVRYYMEGGDEHPGFLLPWEELREGPTGRRYFVDMLTGEIVWKQPKDDKVVALNRPLRWHPKRIIPGKTEEERALYLARREAYVEYWRHYLTVNGMWPLEKSPTTKSTS